jgi:hypothetical protein
MQYFQLRKFTHIDRTQIQRAFLLVIPSNSRISFALLSLTAGRKQKLPQGESLKEKRMKVRMMRVE